MTTENKTISINMENLNETERSQLLALIEKANKQKNNMWKPGIKDKYWYIDPDGDITSHVHTEYNDDQFLEIGNYFRTREEAEFAVERLKVIQQLKELANGFKPDFHSEKDQISIKYNPRWGVIPAIVNDIYILIYFETREAAKKAIVQIGEERLKKYYFCIED